MSNATATLPQPLCDLGMIMPTVAEAKQLDEQGYVILPGIMSADTRRRIGTRLDELEGQVPVVDDLKNFQVEAGTARFANLIDQGPLFDQVWCNPRVLGCAWQVFQREFKQSSLNAREPKAGQGHQPLHADWGARDPSRPFEVVNSLWLIDGYQSDNGATRLVPGTHLLPGGPRDAMTDPAAAHPDEIIVLAPAGSVVVYNAHCWHGGTINRSGARRRVVHSYYTARENAQQQDQRRWLSAETKARLNEAQRWLLDV
ncbi:MAG: phytanoyl-CoA dioxygenase family protein [Planctomycetota bacterium]